MKYLVCRMDGIRPYSRIRSSELPIIVDSEDCANREDIVKKALDCISRGYIGMHEYLCVPLEYASIVSFKPIPQPKFSATIRNFDPYIIT